MAKYELLDKTELSIDGILLENANLNQIADTVAEVLGIDRGDLLVTDVRGEDLVVDILKKGLDPENIVGKEGQLLQSLSKLPGVQMRKGAKIDSRGLLSWVFLDPEEVKEALQKSEKIAEQIRHRLARTAVVFSTGTELANGQVMDTNSPAIKNRLVSEGYSVKFGRTLRDDDLFIAAHLGQTAEEGYSLVITTGGVGAEDKDRTVEAVLLLDPDAATPSIVKYQLGVGRHKHKDSVRIAVGKLFDTLIVALPGPTDEVLLGIDALVKSLAANGTDKNMLAEDIAAVLRKRLHEKTYAEADGCRPG
jgi:molybdenum cofactor synthesis domain-containing protein